ncbi:MAG: hypothetical protein ACPGVG_00400 [Mycobacterium sp.]
MSKDPALREARSNLFRNLMGELTARNDEYLSLTIMTIERVLQLDRRQIKGILEDIEVHLSQEAP